MSDSPNMKRVGHPDCATVEFQLEHFPAPLHWDGLDKLLSWGPLPNPVPEHMEKWDSLIAPLQSLIAREALVHRPSQEAVEEGLKRHLGAYTGIPLWTLAPLKQLFPKQVLATEKLTIRGMRVVKEYWSWLPKDALW